MNTDQGTQFTSIYFVQALKDADIQISLPLVTLLRNALTITDGKGASFKMMRYSVTRANSRLNRLISAA